MTEHGPGPSTGDDESSEDGTPVDGSAQTRPARRGGRLRSGRRAERFDHSPRDGRTVTTDQTGPTGNTQPPEPEPETETEPEPETETETEPNGPPASTLGTAPVRLEHTAAGGVPAVAGDPEFTGHLAVIEVRDVRKTYATGTLEVEALRGVSFDISAGEYVAIMGPSGSGKSTLMHILGCLDVPTSGSFHLAGEDVGSMSEDQLAQVRNRRIGFVFQQFNLLASLSAWRNVELPLVYAGVDRQTRRQRALVALDRVGLSDRIEHRPGELSGGQQQRVAVARALVTDPALILADEPTGNLDSVSARDVLDLLDELHRSGRTIVLITHDADVAQAAERTMRIRDGQVFDAVLATTGVDPR